MSDSPFSHHSLRCLRSAQLLRELQHENIIQVQEVFLNHVTREVPLHRPAPGPPPPPALPFFNDGWCLAAC